MKTLSDEQLMNIANECYLCKNAKCKKYCPINTNIPKVIQLFKENKIDEAGEILFLNNPLSVICSIVCPHEKFCEGNCIKNNKGYGVKFYEIEKYISNLYINKIRLEKENEINKKIAIIGAGPAGLTLSLILAKKGYDITLFDKNSDIGGLLKFGIPNYRLNGEIINVYRNLLKTLNVKIKYNCLIGREIQLSDLTKDGYEAVFLGTGVWQPRKLNIKGENYGNVHYAINYLKEPKNYNLGDEVIIIGAGNVAMDSARVAKRQGAKNVTIVYRKDYSDMVATKIEIAETIEDSVKFEIFKAPVEITDDGVVFSDTIAFTDEKGFRKCENVENSNKLKKASGVIIAVGQIPLDNIVTTTPNLQTKKGGYLLTKENGETTVNGIFAGGDVVTGASTVVQVVADAKKVAENINMYLKK